MNSKPVINREKSVPRLMVLTEAPDGSRTVEPVLLSELVRVLGPVSMTGEKDWYNLVQWDEWGYQSLTNEALVKSLE